MFRIIIFSLAFLLTFVSSDIYDVGDLHDDVYLLRIGNDEYEGLTKHLEVFAPKTEGQFPVILFSSGLGGVLPCGIYSEFVGHIVSYGYVMICPQVLDFISEFDGCGMTEVMDWSEENLQQILIEQEGFPSGFEIDFNNVYVMGHSAGAHPTAGYLEHDCTEKTRGFIMLSPVDTAYEPLITVGEYFSFTLPSVVMPTGLDGAPGTLGFPCAKDQWSNRRFYDAMDGDVWMLNATDFGHADFLDPLIVEANQELQFCATGDDLTSQEYDDYLRYSAGSIVAFILGIEGDCEMLNYMEDTTLMIVDVAAEHKGRGLDTCGLAGCTMRQTTSSTTTTTTSATSTLSIPPSSQSSVTNLPTEDSGTTSGASAMSVLSSIIILQIYSLVAALC